MKDLMLPEIFLSSKSYLSTRYAYKGVLILPYQHVLHWKCAEARHSDTTSLEPHLTAFMTTMALIIISSMYAYGRIGI